VVLFAGTRGYLDGISEDGVPRFQEELLIQMKAQKPEILEDIRLSKVLKPETEKDLTQFLDEFCKVFV